MIDYKGPIKVAEGIYWIGFADDNAGLHCNPYLIVDEDEAVVIDGGSRDDFSTVMMKILQTGTDPNHINRLIYQHYDPDLCGSIPHFESMIHNESLKVLSHRENNIFIKYYATKSPRICVESQGFIYKLKSGRQLEFYQTPYAHSPGSFMTYDKQTSTLFTSDIFGSYDRVWELKLELIDRCGTCTPTRTCTELKTPCAIKGIQDFHIRIMTSTKALNHALDIVEQVNPKRLAPQHGSIIEGEESIKKVIKHLRSLEKVGIDAVL